MRELCVTKELSTAHRAVRTPQAAAGFRLDGFEHNEPSDSA